MVFGAHVKPHGLEAGDAPLVARICVVLLDEAKHELCTVDTGRGVDLLRAANLCDESEGER